MKGRKQPTPEKQLEDFMKRFHEELKKRPTISDEEFMAETEVTDEEYKRGLGFTLAQGEKSISMKELAEEGYMHDFDWNDSLFSDWSYKGIIPDKLEEGFEDMAPAYSAWLKKHNITPGK